MDTKENPMHGCVREIMNPKLLYVRDGDRMTLVRSQIIKYGVTGVPVLDEIHRPVGFVSLRDLVSMEQDRVRVSAPVMTVHQDDSIDAAAQKLAATDYHHAVVVDDDGVAVGIVSAVDFLRALTSIPARHPARFAEEVPRKATA